MTGVQTCALPICFPVTIGIDRISHVGIVIEDNEDGTVWTIEGNTTGDGKKGSQRNGGEACKKLRAFKKNKAGVMISIVGFGRPKFGVKSATKSTTPAASDKPVKKSKTCPTCKQEIK